MNGYTCDECNSWISDDGTCNCTGYEKADNLSTWGSLVELLTPLG